MNKEIVITGVGVLSSVGIDLDTFWNSLCEGKSGIGLLHCISPESDFQVMASELPDFRPKDYVVPKKNIKVMSRDIQIGFVAAALACRQAGLVTGGEDRNVDPERFGVVFGADLIASEIDELLDTIKAGFTDGVHYDYDTWGPMANSKIFPLWMLKYLPNMPASHIGISLDARGPSNTPTLCRVSGLASIMEAIRIIDRGDADIMLAGSCGNHVNPIAVARNASSQQAVYREHPYTVPRPFDADRCGTVLGEGGGAFVIESREHAEARGAKPLTVLRGFAGSMGSRINGSPPQSDSIRLSIELAMERSGITADDLSHVNAEGLGTVEEDAAEAAAIRAELGDVPVVAYKGNFGELSSGSGSVELAASVLSLQNGIIPPTRNHEKTGGDCPINVVHGSPLKSSKRFALKLNQSKTGNACALVIEKG